MVYEMGLLKMGPSKGGSYLVRNEIRFTWMPMLGKKALVSAR